MRQTMSLGQKAGMGIVLAASIGAVIIYRNDIYETFFPKQQGYVMPTLPPPQDTQSAAPLPETQVTMQAAVLPDTSPHQHDEFEVLASRISNLESRLGSEHSSLLPEIMSLRDKQRDSGSSARELELRLANIQIKTSTTYATVDTKFRALAEDKLGTVLFFHTQISGDNRMYWLESGVSKGYADLTRALPQKANATNAAMRIDPAATLISVLAKENMGGTFLEKVEWTYNLVNEKIKLNETSTSLNHPYTTFAKKEGNVYERIIAASSILNAMGIPAGVAQIDGAENLFLGIEVPQKEIVDYSMGDFSVSIGPLAHLETVPTFRPTGRNNPYFVVDMSKSRLMIGGISNALLDAPKTLVLPKQ